MPDSSDTCLFFRTMKTMTIAATTPEPVAMPMIIAPLTPETIAASALINVEAEFGLDANEDRDLDWLPNHRFINARQNHVGPDVDLQNTRHHSQCWLPIHNQRRETLEINESR
jgi:hypothetical protein